MVSHKYIICTSHVYPPIPIRLFDWSAWFDGQEEGPTGEGATEEEAILNLIQGLHTDVGEYHADGYFERVNKLFTSQPKS